MGTLTKKHFEALAEIIHHERMLTDVVAEKAGISNPVYRARDELLRSLTDALVDFGYAHNDNFDSSKFRDACKGDA